MAAAKNLQVKLQLFLLLCNKLLQVREKQTAKGTTHAVHTFHIQEVSSGC